MQSEPTPVLSEYEALERYAFSIGIDPMAWAAIRSDIYELHHPDPEAQYRGIVANVLNPIIAELAALRAEARPAEAERLQCGDSVRRRGMHESDQVGRVRGWSSEGWADVEWYPGAATQRHLCRDLERVDPPAPVAPPDAESAPDAVYIADDDIPSGDAATIIGGRLCRVGTPIQPTEQPAPEAAWQPKVGDRVQGKNGGQHGVVDFLYLASEDNPLPCWDCEVKWEDGRSSAEGFADLQPIPPTAEPGELTPAVYPAPVQCDQCGRLHFEAVCPVCAARDHHDAALAAEYRRGLEAAAAAIDRTRIAYGDLGEPAKADVIRHAILVIRALAAEQGGAG